LIEKSFFVRHNFILCFFSRHWLDLDIVITQLPDSIAYLLRVMGFLVLLLLFFYDFLSSIGCFDSLFVLLNYNSIEVFREMLFQKLETSLVFLVVLPVLSAVSEFIAGRTSAAFPYTSEHAWIEVITLRT
jgi:hypothetical protein